MKHGFSLVELSIVLVILGLLTGGILAGQSLIRASELRTVSTEYVRWAAATQTFRDKYSALPGDMINAERYWGQVAVADADCNTTASTGLPTCNGDGDGNVEVFSTRSREFYRYWQHLANAGLIEGSYNGIQPGAGVYGISPGTNAPGSKIASGAWTIYATADIILHGGWALNIFYPAGVTHFYHVGSTRGGSGGGLNGPLLKNEEAWNLDTKMDDGKPGTGKVTAFNNTQQSTCASSDTAASATYQLSVSGAACVLFLGI